jgi:Zn-dependent protease
MQPDRPYDSDPPGDGAQAFDGPQQYGWSGQDAWSRPQWRSQNPDAKVYPPPPEYFGEPASNWRSPYADDVSLPGDVQRSEAAPSGRAEAAGCALGAGLIALLSKVAIVGKFLIPFGSALLSIGAYALLFGGWQVGMGIVVLLFIHEMGHFFIIRAKGLPASLPVFIPLVGAYVALRRMPQDVRDEAEIAIAGPIAGAIAGAACYLLFLQTGAHLFLLLAYFSFLINLLNLIPVSPLDGGRIVGAISRWIWPAALVLVAVAFFYTHNILLLLLIWFGFMQTVSLFRSAPGMMGYYRIGILPRAYITALYVSLAVGLALGFYVTEQLLTSTIGTSF